MFVTAHAEARITSRLREAGMPVTAHTVTVRLEQEVGNPGSVAYVYELPRTIRCDDGSNGDCIVAIAIDGSVETVYFRRSTQDMSPEFFGAERVIRL